MSCILENYGHARGQGGWPLVAAKLPWYTLKNMQESISFYGMHGMLRYGTNKN